MRYFVRALEEALHRPADVPVSVLRLDMDNFKRINEEFGHPAGDVVMKSYLEAVRDSLHPDGIAYRGRGDEIVAEWNFHHRQRIGSAENQELASANLLINCRHVVSMLHPL